MGVESNKTEWLTSSSFFPFFTSAVLCVCNSEYPIYSLSFKLHLSTGLLSLWFSRYLFNAVRSYGILFFISNFGYFYLPSSPHWSGFADSFIHWTLERTGFCFHNRTCYIFIWEGNGNPPIPLPENSIDRAAWSCCSWGCQELGNRLTPTPPQHTHIYFLYLANHVYLIFLLC